MCDRPFFKFAVKQLFFIVLALVALSISGSLRVSFAVAQPVAAVLAARTDPAPTEVSPEPDRQDIDSLVAAAALITEQTEETENKKQS
jgi:hypothetical protein